MFCTTMSLPKKADVRNISQMWVTISRWVERAGESRRCRLQTKSHWWSTLNSTCPGCVRQETWGWVPDATGKCLDKILGCSGKSFSPYCFINVSKSFASVWKKSPTLQVSDLSLYTKINCGVWPVTPTDNQTSSASSGLPMHNRNLVWNFSNI